MGAAAAGVEACGLWLRGVEVYLSTALARGFRELARKSMLCTNFVSATPCGHPIQLEAISLSAAAKSDQGWGLGFHPFQHANVNNGFHVCFARQSPLRSTCWSLK